MKRGSVWERLHAKYEPCLVTGCWLWTDAPDACGYGRLLVERRALKAHRLSYELHHGPIPDCMCVCHRCDTPACINPAHLFLGTHADNMADMDAKGRRKVVAPHKPQKGSQRPTARLSEVVVAELRRRLADGEAVHQGDEARRLGVNQSVLSRALTGVTWKHVQAAPQRMKRAHATDLQGHDLSLD